MRELLTAALVSISAAAGLAAQPGGNNVLIVIADDLGVDSVGAYGEGTTPPPTPNIDALAARGVLFRNAWANPTCSPTRACLHTGRYSLRTLVGSPIWIGGQGGLRPEEITLPKALDLGNSGYSHALIGKWHLGFGSSGELAPNHAGWSHFAGLLEGAANYSSWLRTENGVSTTSNIYITTAIVDDALAWIQQQSGPWVCCVSFTAPHTPFHIPPAHLHTQNLAGKNPELDPRAFFIAMVEAMDNEIGRLFASLGPAMQRTDVVFLGDNGTLGEVTLPPFSRLRSKATPYEGGVNIPLIVAGPAVGSPGREEPALVSAVDLFSSVLELTSVDAAAVIPPWVTLDAVSLVPYLAGPGRAPLRQTVFAEQFTGGWSTVHQSGFAIIRDDRFKLIRLNFFGGVSTRREELYDLAVDPFERVDLLTGPLSTEARQRHTSLGLELERLRRPTGVLHVFGSTDCDGSAGKPSINGSGTPRPGGSYTVHLNNAPAAAPVALLVGSSFTTWGAVPLPFDLTRIGGGPSCWLSTSGEIVLPAIAGATGGVDVTLSLVPVPELVGRTVYHSWLVLDPGAPNNALGVTTSNALATVLGS